MKKIIKTISLISFALILTIFCLWVLYKANYWQGIHEKPDFELFISEILFKDYETISFSDDENWNTFPPSIWQPNDSIIELPIEWIINTKEFETLDQVTFGIRNISERKFYYMSWGEPNSRMRMDYLIHKDGKIDTLLFDGFGCWTGIYLTPLKNKEEAIGTHLNPLLKNPYSNYNLDIKSDSFPKILRYFYGDSVGIRLKLATYSLPWSKYEPQMIKSDIYMISTDKIIADWKKRFE